ncbi:uncharacterized protein LOC135138627 [Zophobas morio]|uniref:uncharacterized protein LOC135138627 n=1 Tax=Zophobas morio TaxID=2755281 RepID=UPI003083BFEA
MASTSKRTSVDERSETPEKSSPIEHENTSIEINPLQDSSEKFKKRSGTTDVGKDYEHLYIANLILKLIIDDDVENFYLSSNDNLYGSFDDVVVEITFKDRVETYAIQLKHVSRSGEIKIEQLNASSGNFSVENYYKDFKKEPKLSDKRIKMVLFTNSKLNVEHIDEFKFGKLTPCEQYSLLSTSQLGGQSYTFEANENNFKEYEHFLKNMCLYTDQSDVKELKTGILEIFKEYFKSTETAFREYLHFITEWSMQEGNKTKLNKIWMKYMISLCVFSPFIKPLSFGAGGPVDTKRNFFKEAVSKFDLTVINKNNFEKIDSVWSNAVDYVDDMKETINVNNMYQLIEKGIETKESLYDKDATKVSKLMWLLGNSPLVVEGCPQVYETIKLCQVQNLIILDDREKFNGCVKKSSTDPRPDSADGQQKPCLFEKLSDLENHVQLYEDILANFTYSLQGQKDAELKYLLKICEDSGDFITTDDLVEMMEAPLLIGKCQDALPPSHVERKLTKILIDIKFLEKISENTIVLVDCVTDVNYFQQFLPNLVVNKVNDVELIQNTIHEQKIYIYENEISHEEFSALHKKKLEIQFHHFRYLDNHRLEWMESENYGPERKYIDELERFRLQSDFMEYTIHERQYFSYSRQNINIICANAGMGKSTLTKSLKNSSSSTKWIILIYVRNHALHFRKHESNVENFLKYILEEIFKDCFNPFHQKVFKTMLEQYQVQLIWDGLDEASDATQIYIITLVIAFSKKGVKQWLTSRINLRDILENKLDLKLAKNSKCLVGVIYKNLTSLKEFTDADLLKKDIIGRDILEVACAWNKSYPFVKNNIILNDKSFNAEWLISNNKRVVRTLNYRDIAPEFYKISASGHVCFKKLMILLPFLIPLYDGNQFAEEYLVTVLYYAIRFDCPIIYECIENSIPLKTTYNNISSRSILALALFNRSAQILKKVLSEKRFSSEWDCVEELLVLNSEIDEILSFALHFPGFRTDVSNSKGQLLAHYACEKNLTKTLRSLILRKANMNDRDTNGKRPIDLARQKGYSDCLKHIAQIDVLDKDGRLPLHYACEDGDLGVTEILLTNGAKVDIPDKDGQLPIHYAYKHGTLNLVELLVTNGAKFDVPDRGGQLPMHYACRNDGWGRDIFLFLLKKGAKLDVSNGDGQLPIHYACNHGRLNLVELLVTNGAKFDVPDRGGQLPMHYACRNVWWARDIILFLCKKGAKVDVPDGDGQLPIHFACKYGNLNMVELLVTNGAKFDVPDRGGQLPMHYACRNVVWGGDIILFLCKKGAKVDVADGDGQLPIHYACKHGRLNLVELLVTNGAKFDVPDRGGQLPMHYAYRNDGWGCNIILFLCKKGAKVDVPDRDGQLPIHYACKHGRLNLVELLVTNGAKFDVPDRGGQLPIHYACRNVWWARDIILFLCKKGAKVDVPDGDGQLPIHFACKYGNLNMVELLVTNGAKFDVPDRGGQLPMHYACRNVVWGGDIVLFLCKKGAKVDDPDGDGQLPMHCACKHGILNLVELLVTNGAKFDVPDRGGQLPMHYACRNDGWGRDIILFLLEKGAKLDVPDGDGQLPIHYACKHGRLNLVELLVTNGAKFDVPDRGGQLPIHYACRNVWWARDIILFLCKKGAKVDVLDGDGQLPIHYACKHGRLNLVELLVTNGAKFDVPDRGGQLPMHYASRNYCLGRDIILFLCKKGAKVNVPDGDGQLPVHYACKHGRLNLVELLVTNGTKFDVPDRGGQLPMHYACRNYDEGYDIILFLLKKGAKLDVLDGDGQLPIHYACKHGRLNLVKLLVTNGAKFDVPDRGGQLPMHYACRNDGWGRDIILFLCKKGAKVNVPDGDGQLPIHYACKYGNLNMVELLVTNGAKFDVPDRGGQLPMHYACGNDGWGCDIILFLRKNGARVNVPNGDGQLPIHYVCKHGTLHLVELLVTNGAKFDVPDRGGQLPMHYAYRNDRWGCDIILFLCKKGAKVDVPDGDGQLPIHYACKHGTLNLVELLVTNGAKFDVPDRGGQLPMHYACRNDGWGRDIILFLLKKGAKLDVSNGDRQLPIHYACKHGRLNLVELLVTNGAKFDVPDRGGQLPMHYAYRNDRWGCDIILFLCKKGAKVNVPNGDGQLPIHYVCKHGTFNLVKLLVTNGAKFDVPDRGGQLPMHYAYRNDRWGCDIILFLCKRGAKVNVPNGDGQLPIHYVCKHGTFNLVKLLVTNGAKFDVPDRGGQLPMHYAYRNDLWGCDIILFLCKNGARVDVPDGDGQLPIHCACEHGTLNLVKLLVTNVAKFDIPDRGGQLPMHYASRNYWLGCDIILFLLKKGAKLDVPDGDGQLPIHYACKHGRLYLVQLLVTIGAKFDIPDRGGQLPMHYACRNDGWGSDIILFLCKKGAKVNVPNGDGQLPIHYACKHGTLNLVEILVTNGAKFDVPDRGGQLPMHYASRNYWFGRDIILFLLKKGAKLDVPDGDGQLPIHYACKHGRLNLVQLLVTNGAKFDVPDRGGQLPMHHACRNDGWGRDIILFLCKKGAKVDVPDGDGQLPIHYACKYGNLNMVELLVTNGAKFDVPDRGGQLPMHYACRNDGWGRDIILFLCKKGARVNVPNGDGQLPIHYACKHGTLNLVELLVTNGEKFDIPDRSGQLPMHYAFRNDRWGCNIILFLCKKELLVTNGAKFDIPGRGGQLPMHHECRNYDEGYNIILFLLEKGSKVNIPDGNGRLPIHYGCEHGTLSTLKLLVSNGAKVNILDHSGKLRMDYAWKNRNLDSKRRCFIYVKDQREQNRVLVTLSNSYVYAMPYAHMLSRQVIIKKKHFSERGVPKEPAIYVDAPRRIAMGLEQRHHRRIGQFINE